MTTPSKRRRRGTPLNAALQERIHGLWDELATFEAAESGAALTHLLSGVAAMIDVQNAYWMGAVRMTDDELPTSVTPITPAAAVRPISLLPMLSAASCSRFRSQSPRSRQAPPFL